MGRKKAFSDMDLNKALGEGMTNKQIAKKFKVTEASVSVRVKNLKKRNTGAIIANETRQMVSDRLDSFDQLEKINAMANKLMDEATAEPELKLKCAGEIRAQLKLQCEIFESIFSMRRVQLFQQTVLDVMDKVDPEIRKDFVRLLNERKELQGTISYG